MWKRLYLTTLVSAAAFMALAVCAAAQMNRADFDIGESDYIAPPRLITPSTDVVDLSGKDCLEFSWSSHEGDPIRRDHYDLRIYKGYQAYGQYRIYKELLPPRQWSVCVSADMFEDGSAYTIALRQVYSGVKSKRTLQSFKVIKR
jgi:hypothetical protein